MMSMRWKWPLARLAALVVSACSEEHGGSSQDGAAQAEAAAEIPDADASDDPGPEPSDGGGSAEDAAPVEMDAARDAEVQDALTPRADASDTDALDAGAALDASGAQDAGAALDAMDPLDTGAAVDASAALDADNAVDASGDASSPADAGADVVVPPVCNPSAGALLLASGLRVVEVTLSGQEVSSQRVPPGGPPGDVDDALRDLVQDRCGAIFAYQGTFAPAVVMQRDGGWDYASLPGFSTVNNISYGGLALHGAHVFATDMFTFGAEARGVLRFRTADGSGERFGSDDPIDLNVGLDGLLYVLIGEAVLKQLDPETMSLLRSVVLQDEVRGIAVDRDGRIYGASWDGSVYAFQPDGSRFNSLALGLGSLSDIDLNERGVLAVSARGGAIALTSVTLAGWSTLQPFAPYSVDAFVAFTNSGQRAEAPAWTKLADGGVPNQ